MPPFNSLPPEIRRDIVELLDPEFLQENPEHLLICKEWYRYARPRYYGKMDITQMMLRNSAATQYQSQERLAMMRDNMESLTLELGKIEGARLWAPCQLYAYMQRAPAGHRPSARVVREGVCAVWRDLLALDLVHLISVVQASRKLREMTVKAWTPTPVPMLGLRRDYLTVPAVRSLLCVRNLRVLDLDLVGSSLVGPERYGDGQCYFCPTIGRLLESLTKLHLRVRSLCPNITRTPHADTPLRLEELVINISMLETNDAAERSGHVEQCGDAYIRLKDVKRHLRVGCERLKARMEKPRVIRILSHGVRDQKTRSYDVLTGKRMVLPGGAAWTDDGVIDEDEDEDLEDVFGGRENVPEVVIQGLSLALDFL